MGRVRLQHAGRRIARAASRAGEILCICAWALAFLVGAQGWVPVGAQWYAAPGSSLWSPCGSAMCACPIESKTPVQQRAREHAEAGGSCCADGAEPVIEGGHAHGVWLVALGSTRRDDSRGSSMPESLVLELPPLGVGEIDAIFSVCRAALPERTVHSGLAVEVPPTPPRA